MPFSKLKTHIRNDGIVKTIPGTKVKISGVFFVIIYIQAECSSQHGIVRFGLHAMISGNMKRIVTANRYPGPALYGCSGIQNKISFMKTFFGPVDMVHGSPEVKVIIAIGRSVVNKTGIQVKIMKVYFACRKAFTRNSRKSKWC